MQSTRFVGVFAALVASALPASSPAAGTTAPGGDLAPPDAVAAPLRADPAAARLARRLLERDGVVVDVEAPHRMDGGFRGMIAIVPAWPVGGECEHLAWADAAFADFDRFFGALASVEAAGSECVKYKYREVRLRFFRSVGRTTPSAYASGWTIAYNVDGSLMTSADAVRETLFHEIFHLNDEAHGDWSRRVLAPIAASVVQRCGARTECLAPYAPGTTRVRGGTYYAFHPGNGVEEYAAELALRYYREQRAALAGARLAERPFKCGPKENARAWQALASEFFAGIDRTPPCEGQADAGERSAR